MYITTMYIITGASDNHYLTVMNMIDSFIRYKDRHKLIIYYIMGFYALWEIQLFRSIFGHF